MMSDESICECCTCGYTWTRGQSGAHSCTCLLVDKIKKLEIEVNNLKQQRLLLARLAAEKPEFFNPLHVFEAQRLRDEVLGGGG